MKFKRSNTKSRPSAKAERRLFWNHGIGIQQGRKSFTTALPQDMALELRLGAAERRDGCERDDLALPDVEPFTRVRVAEAERREVVLDVRGVFRRIRTGIPDAVAIEADLHVETFLEAVLVRDRALLCERQLHAMLAEDAVRRLQCVLDNAALMEIIVIAPRKSNACICSFCLLL